MNKHTLEILEYDKIISIIKGQTLTPFGKEAVDAIEFLYEKDAIDNKQTEIGQMKDIINFGTPFPLYRMEDCRECLKEATVEGHFLIAPDFRLILQLVDISIELYRYEKSDRSNFPLIEHYLTQIRAFPELKKRIEATFDDDGNVVDNASKKLRSIRIELGENKHKIQRKLDQILASQPKKSGWQDDVVTIRNDRFVIGVPTSNYQSNMGILHDRSQSGATFFIEPKETVELNNRINLLNQEEQMEIVRILRDLTREVAACNEALNDNIKYIAEIDRIHASAMFANKIDGVKPEIIEQACFDLKEVRHPLLLLQFGDKEKVIPNSLTLGNNRQALLITGPNTGGKTVLLKTVGLLILMAQSGLPIPVNQFTKIGIFRRIYADIGDEQSLELSLSTFSSHIRNIITGLENADESTLLLYDEIGAGTDPAEGAALAEATILHGLDKQSKMIVTTHYSSLKTLAMEYPQLDNGSFDFDRETLAPTYNLRLGIPGSSYAVEIAQRLGLPEEICSKAYSLISSGEKSLDKLISALEEELKVLKEDKLELTGKLEKTKQLEALYNIKNDKFKKDIEDEKEKALTETKSFLDTTRKDIEKLVAEIRTSQASEQSVKAFHKKLKDGETKVRNLLTDVKDKPVDHTSYQQGETVEIISLNQRGEIEELLGNDKARVKVGNIFTTVEFRNLKKINQPAQSNINRTSTKMTYSDSESSMSPEIHLRGMTVEEAMENLEKYLDQAIITGLHQIYVIHGKGAGILRRSLTSYLKAHKDVASIRLGDFNEGGLGVTVVRLKD